MKNNFNEFLITKLSELFLRSASETSTTLPLIYSVAILIPDDLVI